jgi:hypothetical protein
MDYFDIQVYYCANSVAFGISFPRPAIKNATREIKATLVLPHANDIPPPSIQNGKRGLPDLDSQINRNSSNNGLLERIKMVKHVMLSSMELFTIIIPSQCRGYS